MRALRSSAKVNTAASSNGAAVKRPSSGVVKLTPEEEQERERKRRRSEKKAERTASKTAEANAIQNTWQKFAKKAEKKGTLKTDKSMFKTPDDPLARGELTFVSFLHTPLLILESQSSGCGGSRQRHDRVWRSQEAYL